MKVLINGEYAFHRCAFCGVEEKGTPWTTHGPGFDHRSTWSEDSSTAPTGWTTIDVYSKTLKGPQVTRQDRCKKCTDANKQAIDLPPDF